MRLEFVKNLPLVLAGLVGLAPQASAQARAEPPALAPEIVAFVTSPAHVAAVAAAASQSFDTLWNCQSSVAAPSTNIRVAADLGPVAFNAAQVPISGVIEESVPVTGCGKTKLQNLFTMSNGSQSKLVTSVPGTTLADPMLVHDTLSRVYAGAKPKLGACTSLRVIDTAFMSFDGGPPSDKTAKTTLGPPWHEIWMVDGCGTTLPVTVHYTPEVTGIAIAAQAAD
jgi:hypothetical protein